jgi:spoIIIJ-associated protein
VIKGGVKKEMDELGTKTHDFLAGMASGFGFDLAVSGEKVPEGYIFDFSGKDTPLLLNESGELLDAFEYLAFQLYGRELDKEQRFICDADGFRKTRRTELLAMARFAAEKVRKTGVSFTFGALNSTERRIIHMVLAEEQDLHSESVGAGRDRRLQVSLK